MPFFNLFKASRKYEVFGPQGGIATAVVLPKGFDPISQKCDMAILMHGFISKKGMPPLPGISKALAAQGIASIRFDFDAHGNSEGDFVDMTMSTEIADARAVFDYVCKLPYVRNIVLVGHSQGGVIAGMLAGQLENHPRRPSCLIQLAPAAVLKDDAIAGQCMNARYDAANPPEYVKVLFHKLGRKFILEAQKLPIYETSGQYTGKVCLIHGSKDSIVPVSYSERYKQTYSDCEYHLIEGESHMCNGKKSGITDIITDFLKKNL